MACLICVGALAFFGIFSVFWCLFGWLLPKTGGVLICPAREGPEELVRRYRWLRGLGLLDCPLLVPEEGLPEPERKWLECAGIEICSREEIIARLGIGEIDLDGTGTGDPAGRHQRGGISEL